MSASFLEIRKQLRDIHLLYFVLYLNTSVGLGLSVHVYALCKTQDTKILHFLAQSN